MALLIDGKQISTDIKDELKETVARLKEQGIEGALAVIQVGADPASSVYVRNKKKACEYIGIRSVSYELPEETTEEELLGIIEKLNDDNTINGILSFRFRHTWMRTRSYVRLHRKRMWTDFTPKMWELWLSVRKALCHVLRQV